jgi:hypothetical protein
LSTPRPTEEIIEILVELIELEREQIKKAVSENPALADKPWSRPRFDCPTCIILIMIYGTVD